MADAAFAEAAGLSVCQSSTATRTRPPANVCFIYTLFQERTFCFQSSRATAAWRSNCVLDGPMTGDAFLTYVGQFLAPVLAKGDVVVLDNPLAHKIAGVRETIRATGANLLYLPPHSPLT
nr:transposase [Roseomonas sp. SXEYE001]